MPPAAYTADNLPIFQLAYPPIPGPNDHPPNLPRQLIFRFHHNVLQHRLLEDLWYNQLDNEDDRTSRNIRGAYRWWRSHAPGTYDLLRFPWTIHWIVAALMWTRLQIDLLLEIAGRKAQEAHAGTNGDSSLMTGHGVGFFENIEDEVRETWGGIYWYFRIATQVPDNAPWRLPEDIRNLWGEVTPDLERESREADAATVPPAFNGVAPAPVAPIINGMAQLTMESALPATNGVNGYGHGQQPNGDPAPHD